MNADDSALWDVLVAAEQLVAKLRAAVNKKDARIEILTAGLGIDTNAWDQRAAMEYLRLFPRDIPHFVPLLFQHALGGSWEALARDVLGSAVRADVLPEVRRLAAEYLPKSDPEDYLQLASVLAAIEAGEALREVVMSADRSDHPGIREAGEFIAARYGYLISADPR